MAYKRKSGEIISRKEWEKLPSELKEGFEPCGEIPNVYYDGEEFQHLEQGLPPEPAAPSGDSEDYNQD